MNISVLENQGDGTLVNKTSALGLGESSGLWNTFYLKDLNEDGQLDIIAGNAGTNLKWKATAEKPVKLYVLDLDENGQPEPLIFYHYFEDYMPFMSLDKLRTQVPMVKKQFTNYQTYADVRDIEDFEQVDIEKIVERKQIKELRSMVYLSDNGQYKGVPLPKEAQMSTIQGITMNQSGGLLFVGNYQEYLTELGESTGNSGGRFANFDIESGTFKDYTSLSLPADLNPRGILPIGDKQYLISCNNSVQYVLRE